MKKVNRAVRLWCSFSLAKSSFFFYLKRRTGAVTYYQECKHSAKIVKTVYKLIIKMIIPVQHVLKISRLY